MGIDFDKGIIWWILVAIPVALVGTVLYRKRVVSAEILVWVFTPLTLIVSNLAAIWQAAPNLHLGLIGVGVYVNDCLEHGEEFKAGGLALAFLDYGHGFSALASKATLGLIPGTDTYSEFSERDIMMRNWTQHWIKEFFNKIETSRLGGKPVRRMMAPLTVTVPLQTPDGPGPDDWPMEGRDPQRTNANPGVTVPPEPNIRWSRTLGFGGIWFPPVVADGIVYVASHNGYLYAFDGTTGRRVWRFRSNAPMATPAVVDGVVYVSGCSSFSGRGSYRLLPEECSLYALEATTGKLLWKYELERGADFQFFDSLIAMDHTIYGIGGFQGGASIEYRPDDKVYAMDLRTSRLKWVVDPENNDLICLTVGDDLLYVSSEFCEGEFCIKESNRRLEALDVRDGRLVWRFEIKEELAETSACPTVSNGLVYIGSTDEYTRGIRQPPYLYALDAATGEQRWRFNPDPANKHFHSIEAIAVADDVIYIGTLEYLPTSRFGFFSTIYALDAVTGEVLWASRIDPEHGDSGLGNPPTVAGGRVYVGTVGWLIAMDAVTGEQLWALNVGENSINDSPVVVDGTIYVASTNILYAIGNPVEDRRTPWWPCAVACLLAIGGGFAMAVMLVALRTMRKRARVAQK